ncbi:MAG: FAD-binding oxidoreductase [Candidatus Binataceae bacterium]
MGRRTGYVSGAGLIAHEQDGGMKKYLPKGVSQAQFDSALSAMRAVVGPEWVIRDSNPLIASYMDTYSAAPESSTAAGAAVCPYTVEEVQKIVRIASQHGVPLWSISTGKNFAYGGPAPRTAGQVVLDLRRMNRIIEVNTDLAYAIVEPGVAYVDFYNHMQRNKIPLWIDCAANGMGGVVGNTVDHGVGYTAYGDHLLLHCGMEVVLADGTLVHTGMGALPGGGRSSPVYQYGYGPFIDGLFTQSNFGVVTKLGMWLMPIPPVFKPFKIQLQNEDDLYQITELLRPLKINMVIPNAAITTHLLWEASVYTTKHQWSTGPGALPPKTLRKIADKFNIGMWNFYAALYGPPEIVDANWKIIQDTFSQIKGAKIYTEENRKGDPSFDYRVKLMRGEPNLTEFSLLNWVGGGGHINFSPISPASGTDAMSQFHTIRKSCEKFGFDYIGEFVIGWREQHHILMLMFDRYNADESRRAHDCFAEQINLAAAKGYGEYRTNLHFMDQIAATYDANGGAMLKMQRRMKRALDPKGILSPGKNGIWPLAGSEENA